jgi:transposase
MLCRQKTGFQEHFAFGERFIWAHTSEVDGRKLHLFLDERLRGCEEQDYLRRHAKDPATYTMEKFHEKSPQFGTLALLSTIPTLSAETVYTYYKSRNEIEVMIDALKNILHADRSYMQNDEALEGWTFVNFLALTWYYVMYQRLRAKELLTKFTPMDIFHHLQEIKKVKIEDSWHLCEITEKTRVLLSQLGIPIT